MSSESGTNSTSSGRRMLGPKYGHLHDYATGRYIRPATQRERDESREAAQWDGGAGVIVVRWGGQRPQSCYVEE